MSIILWNYPFIKVFIAAQSIRLQWFGSRRKIYLIQFTALDFNLIQVNVFRSEGRDNHRDQTFNRAWNFIIMQPCYHPGVWFDKSKKSSTMGIGPGSPFGLEDKAPWKFKDSPHPHKQETRGLDTIQAASVFPWWLLLFFHKKFEAKGDFKIFPSPQNFCERREVATKERQKSQVWLSRQARGSWGIIFRPGVGMFVMTLSH